MRKMEISFYYRNRPGRYRLDKTMHCYLYCFERSMITPNKFILSPTVTKGIRESSTDK
ncbi:Uncharacterised protein [Providencia stuartii]|nr:Uncharacterised protein [Providencia stuartii]